MAATDAVPPAPASASEAQFSIDGRTYRTAELPQEGLQLLQLLSQSQAELARLQMQISLVQAAQQHILSRLKPLLPEPVAITNSIAYGQASAELPSTPANPATPEPPALPTPPA